MVRPMVCAVVCTVLVAVPCSETLSAEERKVASAESPQTSFGMPHGEVREGLAAFVLCHRNRFKVGEPIPLSYGLVLVGPGLDKQNEGTAKLRVRVLKPRAISDPENYSWYEVTGPDGQKVPWRGGNETLPMNILPSDERCAILRHGDFVGDTDRDLGEEMGGTARFDLTRPGTYKVRWGYHPDTVDGVWSGGPLLSNEVQFEITGDSAKAKDQSPMKDAPDGPQPRGSDRVLKQLLKQAPDESDRRSSSSRDAIRHFLRFHEGPELKWAFKDDKGRQREIVHTRVLVVSRFLDDGTTVLRYMVSDTGRSQGCVDIWNWAKQGSSDKQLDKEQLSRLHSLLSRLPKSAAVPPIRRTVCVSFKGSDAWRTETYDTERLPTELESVLKMLDRRSEMRDRHRSRTK